MPTFCDRCGAPLGADDQRCRTCGWPVPATDPAATQQVPAPVIDQPTSRSPLAAAEPDSPYARPSTTAPAEDDPYAGWFVDDQPPARTAPPAGTSYDPDERAAAAADPSGWDESGWRQYEDDPRLPSPQPLGEDEPLDLDGGARRSGAGRLLGALAVVALVVLVGLGAIYFGVLRGNGGGTPSAGTTPSRAESAPPGSGAATSPGSGGSSAPSSATSTSPYPPVSLTGKACGGSGSGPWGRAAAGSSATSCAFALAVQQAWLASNPQAGDSRTVTATSPVTNKSYPMTCAGDQPVTCKGGNGAVVYLYGGTATFG